MDVGKLKDLLGKVKIELPKLERKSVEPREKRVRDLKTEVEVDSLTSELFRGLAEQNSLLRRLTAVKAPGAEVTMQIEALQTAISEAKQAVKADLGLYAMWVSGPLGAEDELAVSLDLALRGVLTEISQEDASKLEAAWSEYRELQRMGKDGDDEDEESGVRRPQKLFRVKETTGNSSRPRFFVKRMIPKGEQFPEGYSRLMAAYAAHFRQKQQHYRDLQQMAGTMVKELGVDQEKTLANVEAGEAAVVAFLVEASHEWRSQDGRSLIGTVVVKCHGTESGIAKLQILGAVGNIFSSLRRHIPLEEGDEGTVFAYKAGRAFEGMSKAETGEDQGWLRALLTKVGGFSNGRGRRPQFATQFTPQTARGHRSDEDQEPRKAKGRRDKKRGGGKRRDDADRFDDKDK